jgi:hypothetical protein
VTGAPLAPRTVAGGVRRLETVGKPVRGAPVIG